MRRPILVVEDQPTIADLVQRYLERDGHAVRRAATAAEAVIAADVEPRPQLAVLDLGLPDADGLGLARRLSARMPVVVLTARGDEPDRIAGFDAGAEDYVTKPFSPRELVARVRVVLRRGAPAAPVETSLGSLRLSAATRRATLGADELDLTQKEFDLLWELVAAGGHVLSRDALRERVWGQEGGPSRTVDQHVAQLRRKVGAATIETVRGLGYRAAAP